MSACALVFFVRASVLVCLETCSICTYVRVGMCVSLYVCVCEFSCNRDIWTQLKSQRDEKNLILCPIRVLLFKNKRRSTTDPINPFFLKSQCSMLRSFYAFLQN